MVAGTTVRWEWFWGGHTVVSYAQTAPGTPDWQSPTVLKGTGQFYEQTFTTPGTITYYCSIAATRADADPAVYDEKVDQGRMVGEITVLPATAASLPTAGGAPPSGGLGRPLALALAGVIVAVLITGAIARQRPKA